MPASASSVLGVFMRRFGISLLLICMPLIAMWPVNVVVTSRAVWVRIFPISAALHDEVLQRCRASPHRGVHAQVHDVSVDERRNERATSGSFPRRQTGEGRD